MLDTMLGWLFVTVLFGCITGLLVVSALLIPPLRRAARRRRWTRLLVVALGLLVWAPFFLYRGYASATGAVYWSAFPDGGNWDDFEAGEGGIFLVVDQEIYDNRAAIARELWVRWIVPGSPPCRAAGDVCRLVEQVEKENPMALRAWDAQIFIGFDLASALAGGATAWILVRPGVVGRRRSRYREAVGVFLRLFLASAWLTWVLLYVSVFLLIGVVIAATSPIITDGVAPDVNVWQAFWVVALTGGVGVAALVGLVVTAVLAWRARRAARSAGVGEEARE